MAEYPERIWALMDRTAIKAHIIRKLREFIGDGYNITGDYSENINNVMVVVSINGEQQIVGRGSGRLSYDYITGEERTLYITNVGVQITVYAPIDEEAASVCGIAQRAIDEHRYELLNDDIGIKAVFDTTVVSPPVKREGGERKTWASSVGLTISVHEIIESVPT